MRRVIVQLPFFTAIFFLIAVVSPYSAPNEKEVLAAMHKASDFMANEVSYRGGYLFDYSADLNEQWGEAPARPSQIWVQTTTPSAGEMFLEAYAVTKDKTYLTYAERATNALIYGQHPTGGFHYFIDFDKPGLDQWYKDVFSQFKWGMEEFRHYYGNCTYDDQVTQGATRFLLRMTVARGLRKLAYMMLP